MQDILHMAGYSPKSFNTHSFRIGRATDMALEGCSDQQIKLAGRWKSYAFKDYIKPYLIRL